MVNFSLNTMPLEGDGVVENLFHFLWSKDELDNGLNINIPDTVIYKFRQPAYWYFTSKSGQIKKKARYNLANIRIEEAFTRKVMGSDIVAYYLSTNSETGKTTIEYFDKTTFRDFLYNREKVDNGILQRFVEPKGTRNVMMRAVWSPKIVLLERRENRQHLVDKKFTLYERAVTYEGAEHFSEPAPVRGSILPISVQNVCENVVNHVSEVSFRKNNISRMALNFKVDGEDRLWLLWCTSLRLEENVPVFRDSEVESSSYLATMRQKVPSKQGPVSLFTHCEFPESVQKAFMTTKSSRAINMKGDPTRTIESLGSPGHMHSHEFNNKTSAAGPGAPATGAAGTVSVEMTKCKSCASNVLMDRFYHVPYKTIVAHFEQFMALLAAENSETMKIEWPPAPSIIKAMGGVGLGPLETLREAVRNSKDRSKVVISGEDIEIPPIIRQAHPNLSAVDYRRFRRDPMFLYKTSSVCEECYLVFARIAGESGGEGDGTPLMSLGSPAPSVSDSALKARLRRKDQRAAEDHVERTSRQRLAAKAKRRQERERKKVAKAFKSKAAAHVSGNELIKLQGPRMPPRIDDTNVAELAITRSAPVLQTQLDFQAEQAAAKAKAIDYTNNMHVPDEFKEELQERENAFFRDLYANPNLAHGHPLSHMISTHGKLAASQAGIGGVAERQSNSAQSGERPRSGGKKQLKPVQHQRLSPRAAAAAAEAELQLDYSSPYAKTQVVHVPKALQKAQQKKNRDRQRSRSPTSRMADPAFGKLDPLDGTAMQTRPTSSESQAAADHRSFLLSTLQRVQDQLDNPIPLEQSLGLDRAADVAGALADEGRNFGEAWEAREEAFLKMQDNVGSVYQGPILVGGQRLMAAVDLADDDQFHITVFNPKLANSQKLDVPMSVVLENAPPDVTSSEDLARFVLENLEKSAQPEMLGAGDQDRPNLQLPFFD